MCGVGDAIYAASSATDNGITTDSVGLFRTTEQGGEPWDEVARVDLTDPVPGAGSADLACAGENAYWATTNQPGALVAFDLASGNGDQVSDLWSDGNISTVSMCSGSDDVVVSGASADRSTAHYRLLIDASPEPPDDEVTSTGPVSAPPKACPIGDGIVDASQVLTSSDQAALVE